MPCFGGRKFFSPRAGGEVKRAAGRSKGNTELPCPSDLSAAHGVAEQNRLHDQGVATPFESRLRMLRRQTESPPRRLLLSCGIVFLPSPSQRPGHDGDGKKMLALADAPSGSLADPRMSDVWRWDNPALETVGPLEDRPAA